MSYLKYFNDESINLARGLMRNATFQHKFGAVPAMSQNQTGTVWDINDTLYPWSAFSSGASIVNVDRLDVGDAGKSVYIEGLDANYNIVSDTVTLTDASNNNSTVEFIRVYRAYMTNGSATNVGTINIQVGSTNVARITAGKGQTLMAVYTIPAGYTGYLMKGTCSCQAGADATGDMFVRYFGQNAFRVGHSFEVSGAGGQYLYDFATPIPIPEKSDIDVRATVRSNNARLTAAFDIILVENDGTGLR